MAGLAGPLDGEEALAGPRLAGPVTGWAGDRLRALLAARARAGLAAHRGRHADHRLTALEGLLEGDLQIVAQIGAAPARPAAALSHEIAEHLVEDVGEARGREIEAGV